mmetsp:Transcript_3401/g.5609  ORF Transcript_3401/g.5609 Transcript_3401/m.5609 type:complete len:299 (+) Transcript_3401:260-1156(+)
MASPSGSGGGVERSASDLKAANGPSLNSSSLASASFSSLVAFLRAGPASLAAFFAALSAASPAVLASAAAVDSSSAFLRASSAVASSVFAVSTAAARSAFPGPPSARMVLNFSTSLPNSESNCSKTTLSKSPRSSLALLSAAGTVSIKPPSIETLNSFNLAIKLLIIFGKFSAVPSLMGVYMSAMTVSRVAFLASAFSRSLLPCVSAASAVSTASFALLTASSASVHTCSFSTSSFARASRPSSAFVSSSFLVTSPSFASSSFAVASVMAASKAFSMVSMALPSMSTTLLCVSCLQSL